MAFFRIHNSLDLFRSVLNSVRSAVDLPFPYIEQLRVHQTSWKYFCYTPEDQVQLVLERISEMNVGWALVSHAELVIDLAWSQLLPRLEMKSKGYPYLIHDSHSGFLEVLSTILLDLGVGARGGGALLESLAARDA